MKIQKNKKRKVFYSHNRMIVKSKRIIKSNNIEKDIKKIKTNKDRFFKMLIYNKLILNKKIFVINKKIKI